MKKKECPSCAMEIEANSKVCPICSYEFPGNSNIGFRAIAILLIIAMIFLLIAGW